MSGRPKNFSQAIDDLEKDQPSSGGGDFQSRMRSEFNKVEEALDSLRPHIEEFSGRVGEEARKAKRKVQDKVEENPWAAMSIVGLVFFVLGFLFASKRRD